MKLVDAYICDRVNCYWYKSLYKTEQFETILIEIGAFWELDPCVRNLTSLFTLDLLYSLYLKNQTSHEFPVIEYVSPISGLILYAVLALLGFFQILTPVAIPV